MECELKDDVMKKATQKPRRDTAEPSNASTYTADGGVQKHLTAEAVLAKFTELCDAISDGADEETCGRAYKASKASKCFFQSSNLISDLVGGSHPGR